jgi:YegS/Rv2252/BmrU family lipid kinase
MSVVAPEVAGSGQVERTEPFLVVNPQSGGGSTGRRWPRLEAQAKAVFGSLGYALTTKPLEATALTRRALESGYRTIIAVGGDGTMNEVVNGFFGADGLPVAPGAAVALLPAGTGGDFRRTVKIPTAWAAAARHIAAAPVRMVDVGRIRYQAHDGTQGQRYFINVASCGVPGEVDAEVNRSGKWLGGKLSFMLSSLRVLSRHKDKRVRITVDDGVPEEVRVTALAMGNGQYFGGGMRVTPEAKLDDGLFHCTLWTGYTMKDFVIKAGGVYSGTHVKWPGTRCFTARKVLAESGETVLVDVDGEQPGRLPATFELLPGAIGLRA